MISTIISRIQLGGKLWRSQEHALVSGRGDKGTVKFNINCQPHPNLGRNDKTSDHIPHARYALMKGGGASLL